MNLILDQSIANNYKCQSQKIRVMSEYWAVNNLFCPCCGYMNLMKMPNNYPTADMCCNFCGAKFELKSKNGNIGKKIVDGAYETMINRISSDFLNKAKYLL